MLLDTGLCCLCYNTFKTTITNSLVYPFMSASTDISLLIWYAKHRNTETINKVCQAKNACGSSTSCVLRHGSATFHGIDHYWTTAYFFMSSNIDLVALISDRLTAHPSIENTESRSTWIDVNRCTSGRAAPLCISNACDAIFDDVALTVFTCRAGRMHGIWFLVRAAAFSIIITHPLQCRIAARGTASSACIS
jgi:hypothetical protein